MLFSKSILGASLVLFGLAQADFYIGTASGLMTDGGLNTPALDSYTTYILQIGDQDICNSSTIGGDPTQPSTNPSAPWTNFCGRAMSNNSWNVMLNPSDTCGSNMAGNEDVPDGTFYADVIDLDNNNSTVGSCVSSYSGTTDCASWGSTEAETYIHCYTDALSSPKLAVSSSPGSVPFATHTEFGTPTFTPTPAARRRIKRTF